jgi:cytidylate kinase
MKFRKSIEVFSHFANSLVMQLTVMPNVSTSLIDISDYLDKEQKDIISNEELLINERLDLLDKYYDFPLYYVFKEI